MLFTPNTPIHCLTATQTRTLRERKKRVVHADVEPDDDEDNYDGPNDDCACYSWLSFIGRELSVQVSGNSRAFAPNQEAQSWERKHGLKVEVKEER